MSFSLACWSSRNVLDLYVDGRLAPRAAGRVEAHLAACAACRREAEALKPIRLPAGSVSAPAGLADAILKQLEAGAEPARTAAPAWRLAPSQAAALVYLALLAAGNAGPGYVSQGLLAAKTDLGDSSPPTSLRPNIETSIRPSFRVPEGRR